MNYQIENYDFLDILKYHQFYTCISVFESLD